MAQKHSILLVEDNPDDEALTIMALRKCGVVNEIVVKRDGAEAVSYLTQPVSADSPRPALVLLDLKLPKINGLEVLQQIRAIENTKLIPVVVLTTSNEDEDIVRSYSYGANSYVRKPVDFEAFQESVRQLGLYWLSINEGSHLAR